MDPRRAFDFQNFGTGRIDALNRPQLGSNDRWNSVDVPDSYCSSPRASTVSGVPSTMSCAVCCWLQSATSLAALL